MADPILPRAQSLVLDARGYPTREWYDFFRDLLALAGVQTNLEAQILALAQAVAELQAATPDLGQLFGDMSVAVDGLLGQVVQLRLVNDATAPGATYYYGTDADGTKGWHLLGDALLEGTGITLTVDGTTGEITIALADLADAGGGSFLLFTRDAQGRVSGTSAGDASDVPYDDAGNTYVLGANAQAALDATDTALAGKQPLDTDLTAIAALTPANDDVIQRKAGAWTNRTMAQLLADLGIAGSYQPLDATLTALASQNWALNALPIGSGADTVSQVAFAANTFPARASTGNLVAKTITDDALLLLADATVPRLGTTNTWALTQTFSLAPIVSSGAVNALFVLDANAGTAKRIVARTGGVNRLQWGADGSDNYVLNCYDNTGALLGTAYSVDRLTRVLTFSAHFFGRKPWAFATAATGSNTPNLDTLDATIRTALAGTITINNPTGTKRNGQPYTFRLRDDGTGRAINWGSEYRAMGVALPTATVANKTLRIMFEANADENTMDLVSVTQQL